MIDEEIRELRHSLDVAWSARAEHRLLLLCARTGDVSAPLLEIDHLLESIASCDRPLAARPTLLTVSWALDSVLDKRDLELAWWLPRQPRERYLSRPVVLVLRSDGFVTISIAVRGTNTLTPGEVWPALYPWSTVRDRPTAPLSRRLRTWADQDDPPRVFARFLASWIYRDRFRMPLPAARVLARELRRKVAGLEVGRETTGSTDEIRFARFESAHLRREKWALTNVTDRARAHRSAALSEGGAS